ncbi:hypothetical protein D3C83_70220 [compost metagenome]
MKPYPPCSCRHSSMIRFSRSEVQYFAIDAVAVSSFFCSNSSMQRSTKTRATCASVVSSASLKRVFWKLATGLPNAFLSRT